jgi:predicted HicB family RNase H-like nuclease
MKALNVRMDSVLRENLDKAAKENNRSLNAEIIHRLRRSFEGYRKL